MGSNVNRITCAKNPCTQRPQTGNTYNFFTLLVQLQPPPARDDLAVDLKPLCTSSHCEVPLWGFNFNWSGILWFKLVESFILYFLGGVLFYTHYLRWSLFLARFRIIILKEGGQPLDSTTGHKPRATESNLCQESMGKGVRAKWKLLLKMSAACKGGRNVHELFFLPCSGCCLVTASILETFFHHVPANLYGQYLTRDALVPLFRQFGGKRGSRKVSS